MGRARGTAGKWALESGAHGADQWAWRGVVKGDTRVGRARWCGPGKAALRAGRGGKREQAGASRAWGVGAGLGREESGPRERVGLG